MNPKRLYISSWWAGLVSVLVLGLNLIFGWDIPSEELVAGAGIIAAFILGESYRKSKAPPQ